jgi:hypothetical protein
MIYKITKDKKHNKNLEDYYYQPKGYSNFAKFSPSCKDVMGTPIHNVALPEGAVLVEELSRGVQVMKTFLDNYFAK